MELPSENNIQRPAELNQFLFNSVILGTDLLHFQCDFINKILTCLVKLLCKLGADCGCYNRVHVIEIMLPAIVIKRFFFYPAFFG